MQRLTIQYRTHVTEADKTKLSASLDQATRLVGNGHEVIKALIIVAEQNFRKTIDEINSGAARGKYRETNAVTVPKETSDGPEYFVLMKDHCIAFRNEALLSIITEELFHARLFDIVYEKRGYIRRDPNDFLERLDGLSQHFVSEYVVHKWLSSVVEPESADVQSLIHLIMEINSGVSGSFVNIMRGLHSSRDLVIWFILADWLYPMFYHLSSYAGLYGISSNEALTTAPTYSKFLAQIWEKIEMEIQGLIKNNFTDIDSRVRAVSMHLCSYLAQFNILIYADRLAYADAT